MFKQVDGTTPHLSDIKNADSSNKIYLNNDTDSYGFS
jgi:hypothetical protein